jgi:hypothetical protein
VVVEGEEIGGIMAAIFSANDKGEEKGKGRMKWRGKRKKAMERR